MTSRHTAGRASNIDNGTMESESASSKPGLPSYKKTDQEKLVPYMRTFMGREYNYVVLVTHANIALYSIIFWMQQGITPYLTKKFDMDTVQYGYLQTTFAVMQLFGGPLFGRFGDLLGGQAALILSMASTAVSALMLGLANSVPWIFASKIPSLFMHGMQAGQMVVTDMSLEHKRSDGLGKLGISYGVGFVVGPLIGGTITKVYGPQAPSLVGVILALLSIVSIKIFIPEHTKVHHEKTQSEEAGSSVFSLKKLMSLLKYPGTGFLLCIRFLNSIPTGIFQSMFSIVFVQVFKLEPQHTGMLMAYVGILSMLLQGFGVGFLSKRFNDNKLIQLSTYLLMFAYLGLSFFTDLWQFILIILPLVTGMTIQTVIISSALTKSVTHADTGAILGINMGVNSLVRTFSPTVGGIMLQQLGHHSVGYFGLIMSSFVVVFLFINMRKRQDIT